jgi:hypothetical protein
VNCNELSAANSCSCAAEVQASNNTKLPDLSRRESSSTDICLIKTRSIIAYFLADSYLRFSKCYEVENTTIRFSVEISTNSYR